jgi:hypothetical protein
VAGQPDVGEIKGRDVMKRTLLVAVVVLALAVPALAQQGQGQGRGPAGDPDGGHAPAIDRRGVRSGDRVPPG